MVEKPGLREKGRGFTEYGLGAFEIRALRDAE